MRFVLFFFAFFHLGFLFSQTQPFASDVSVAHFKDTDGIIHLVGSDMQFNDLTYTIVTLPTHGTLKDIGNSDAVISAGSTISGNRVKFVPFSDETGQTDHNYIFSGTNTFTYKVTDVDGTSADKTVTVKVFDSYLSNPTVLGTIQGEAAQDKLGRSVSFSEKGDIIAIGSPYNDAGVTNSDRGSVEVYNFDGTNWNQVGNDINGSQDQAYFGSSVSLSGDGTILAVGIPYHDISGNTNNGQIKIYQWKDNTWDLMETITPAYDGTGSDKSDSEQFGNDVRLSSDGKTVAISDIWYSKSGGNQVGRVVAYRFNGSEWDPIGGQVNALVGGNAGDNLSWAISLSANGNIMAVGAHEYDKNTSKGDNTNKSNAGKVIVYEYNSSTQVWDIKQKLTGTETQEKFGAAIDLSSDGLTIAIGSPYYRVNGAGDYLGKTSVYQWNGTTYASIGQSIVGSAKYDFSGAHVSLDNEGNTLAIMDPGHDTNASSLLKKGRVRVYNFDSGSSSWVQTPPENNHFDGVDDGDQSASNNAESKGQRVFLSGDGSVLAMAADENDGGGTNAGHVRIFKLFENQKIPQSQSETVTYDLYEQVTSSDEITLSGSDPDSGPNPLIYVITELNTAKLFEGSNEISSSNVPYTLTGNKVKYNSNSDTVVNDSFKFIVHDGKASSIPSTITLTVIPDNDPPVANAQSKSTDEDVLLNLTLTGSDVDSTDADLIYIVGTLPSNGSLKEGDNTITSADTVLTGSSISYTPNSNYSGSDSFDFKVRDKGVNEDGVTDVETSSAASIAITVNNVDNDPPIAQNKSIKTGQDSESSTITLVANDPDSNDSSIVYTIASLPSNGKLKDGGSEISTPGDLTGALTYLPNSGYVGNDSFTFTAKDDQAATSTEATVSISVSDTNDNPVAQSQTVTAYEDTQSQTIELKATDPDASDTSFSFHIASLPSNGVLKDNNTEITSIGELSGAFLTYTPSSNFVGNDSFTFTAKDDELAESSPATVSITVNNTNDPPTAQSQNVSTREDVTTNPVITLSASDIDATDTSFSFTIKSLPSNGVLKDGATEIKSVDTDLSGANLTYTPNLNYNGNDSFKFTAKDDENAESSEATVSITITPWNDPPIADAQDLTTDENVNLSITVSGTDVDGDNLTYILFSLPSNGVLKQGDVTIAAVDLPKTLSSNEFTYVPNAGYNGSDSFKFKVRDLTPDSFANANSMILIKDGANEITYETEFGKTFFLIQSTPTKMDWPDAKTLTDSYYGARMYVVLNADMEKKVYDALQSMNRLDGPFWMGLYQDRNASDYSEPFGGWYWVDGKKLGSSERPYTNWHTGEPNDAGDEDYGQFNFGGFGIEWNDMSVGNGQSYALFEFTAEDSTAEIKITVSEFNDPPVANDQNVSTDEDTDLDITLSATDAETTSLTYIITEYPIHGDLKEGDTRIGKNDLPKTLSSNSIKYDPHFSFNGSDTFKFKVKDSGASDGSNIKESPDATVTVTVNSVNDIPVAKDQSLETDEDVSVEITHEGTDADQNTSLDYLIVTLPSNGTLKDGATEISAGDLPKKLSSSKVIYTPTLNYNGDDSYTFKVNDGISDSQTNATISIKIKPVSDPPVANDQNVTTNEDTPLTIKLTGSDIENDPLTYLVKSLPSSGKLKNGDQTILQSELPKLLPADSLTYVPNADFFGNDSFEFMINANYLNSFSKANDLKFITNNGEPVTYQKPEGKTYFLIQENTGSSGSPIDWTTAKALTNSIDGAKMYIILNAEMELLVWNGLKSMGLTGKGGLYYWIGLYQDRTASDYSEPSGGWYWDDGVKLGSSERPYTNWYTGEPNNAGAEDYAQFEFSSNGPDGIKWNDMSIGNAQSWPLFEFSISGSSDSNTAKISIEVKEVNDPPIADSQNLSLDEDTSLDVTLNATDPEAAITMNYVIKSLPTKGKLLENSTEISSVDLPKVLSGKDVSYQPNPDFNGDDSFEFYAVDSNCPNTNTSKLEVTGDFTATATGTNPMVISPQNIKGNASINEKQVDIKFTVGQGDIFQSCEIELNVRSFDDGLQFTIDGVKLLNFNQYHWDSGTGANTTEFNGNGRFVTAGSMWMPWTSGGGSNGNAGQGNPKLVISNGKIKLMVDTKNGTREDALPFMDKSVSEWALVDSFSYDCEKGFNLLIGNQNHSGPGGIDADLTVEANIVPCEESNVAKISFNVNPINDPPVADDQTVNTDEDLAVDITHTATDKDLVNIFTVHTQMGTDIQDSDSNVQMGESITISADGTRALFGAWVPGAGFARVYNWDGTSWKKMGQDVLGTDNADIYGEYVSMNDQGTLIAIAAPDHDSDRGEVKVYNWDGTKWGNVTNVFEGKAAGDKFGKRGIHISGDGNTLSIASFRKGYIKTFKWDGTNWNEKNELSVVSGDNDVVGQLYLTKDGKRLAVGTKFSNSSQGQVNVYDWNGTDSWNKTITIDGMSANEGFGNTIDMSRNGNFLVAGAINSKKTRVYDISGSSASQIGNDIDYGGGFWRYVSITDDGNRVAIPQYGVDDKTAVFDWNGTVWSQLGNPISANNMWGESIDMSRDGKVLVIGGHNGLNKVFNILNMKYIITSYPSNGILKEGSKTIAITDLPYTLDGVSATYVPNSGFYGEDKYNFKVNDGKVDSNIATVTIKIKEFILDLPNNYKITTTETCKGSDFGIIDIEVAATSYKKTASGPDIPITYNVAIEGKGDIGKIVSPNKTLQIKDLAEGTHKLVFTVQSEPKYEFKVDAIITASDPPVAHSVSKIEICDDIKDGDDKNGKAEFDTSTILTQLLTNPTNNVKQDENLFNYEFTYFDETTSANVTKSTLPNPFYSATQTINVKFISKANGKCEAIQTIDFQVNSLPLIERIEDTKSVCLNLPPVTIGVKSTDNRNYTYTWTRNGTVFPNNITGIDSSILIGAGGEYVVTATTTDGTNCSTSMSIKIDESNIATFTIKDMKIKDLEAGPNNSISIDTLNLGIGDYEFSIDDQIGPYQDSPIFDKVRPGKHTVYIRDKNGCGIVNQDVWVIGYKKFFTPNGDGYTDKWNVIGVTKDYQPRSKVYIFDRFGKLLKELDPLSEGWNGNFNGKPMPQTDYWFKIILEDGRTFRGHFSLIRAW